MTTALETTNHQAPAQLAPSIGELQERLAKAKEFLETVLVPAKLDGPWAQRTDGDYGVIPGCGTKPVLFKAGAEKLARLFDVSVAGLDRTLMERIDVRHELLADDDPAVPGYMFAYRCSIAGPDGRPWGAAEAFASHEETTFHEFAWDGHGSSRRKTEFRGLAPVNTLAARAQKRAYVRALVQALGMTSLVSTHDAAAASDLLTETQRDIGVAVYEHVSPRMVELARRQATQIKASRWSSWLGAALDIAADARGWTDTQRERAELLLTDPLATRETVDELLGAPLEGELEEAVS